MKAVVEGLNARWSQPASLRLRELYAVSLEQQPLDASASRSTPKPKRLPAGSARASNSLFRRKNSLFR